MATGTVTSLPVWETMTAAWAKVSGTKSSMWGAILVTLLIGLGFAFLQSFLSHIKPVSLLLSMIAQIILLILQAGLIYIGIRRAFDLPFSYDLVFRGFDLNIALRIIGAYILQSIILMLPLILIFIFGFIAGYTQMHWIGMLGSIIGGIIIAYLIVRLLLVIPFVIDKVVGPWQAIVLSFRATRHHFWSLLAIVILTWIFLLICAIPFGIGLIWGLPFAFILTGMIYKILSTNVRA